jgi:glycosyltransferase involved in cell wall biosynthesis
VRGGAENRPLVTVFLREVAGGVATSMLRWGSQASPDKSISYVLTKDETRPCAPIDFPLPGHTRRITFDGVLDNRFKVYRRCADALRSPDEWIVANDVLELGMVSALRIPNPLAFFLHGDYDYYYDLACAHRGRIGTFACVSRRVHEELTARMPERTADIRLAYPIVPEFQQARVPTFDTSPIRLLFVGRLTVEKGFDMLPAIDAELERRKITAAWTVVAPRYGPSIATGEDWLRKPNVARQESVNPAGMSAVYAVHDILVAPSRREGFGMAVLEASKCGTVPIVCRLKAGVPELVDDGVTGFIVGDDDAAGIAERIAVLTRDRRKLMEMGAAARTTANARFGSDSCAAAMTEAILAARPRPADPADSPGYLSRLDRSWLPNSVVRFARSALSRSRATAGTSAGSAG